MKKSSLLILIVALLLFVPKVVNALSVEREFSTLTDFFSEEQKSETDYAEKGDQVIIYLFRGEGCGHCKEFIEYLTTSLVKTHGNKFKLRAYEVWYATANKELMEDVADYFNINVNGVPFIVIGDQKWVGFSEDYKTEIENSGIVCLRTFLFPNKG